MKNVLKGLHFPEGKNLFGRDRHPAECDCQRNKKVESDCEIEL